MANSVPCLLCKLSWPAPMSWGPGPNASAASQVDWEDALLTSTTIYIGNLAFTTREEQLYDVFGRVGHMKRIVMGLDKNVKTPCGFAFAIYYTREVMLLYWFAVLLGIFCCIHTFWRGGVQRLLARTAPGLVSRVERTLSNIYLTFLRIVVPRIWHVCFQTCIVSRSRVLLPATWLLLHHGPYGPGKNVHQRHPRGVLSHSTSRLHD